MAPPSPPEPPPPDPFAAAAADLARQMGVDYGRMKPEPEAPKPTMPAFPHGDRPEPITALKAAWIRTDQGNVTFASLVAHDGGDLASYGAVAEASCHCGHADPYSMLLSRTSYAAMLGYHETPRASHPQPGKDTACGFYAWKDGQPFPWQEGTWLLEADLYGRVIEHERGYRAQKQRVLRISPVPGLICEPPFRLAVREGRVVALCGSCPARRKDHPITADRLRRFLNVEIDLERAWRMRENEPKGA
jgi:hypothetical protein